jgi:lysophospholipase L1-like esterase
MKGFMLTASVALGLAAMTGSAAASGAAAAAGPAAATGSMAGAAAGAQPKVTPGSTYLALGDSVTFGYEEQAVVPAPNYHNASSFIAYPQLVGQALKLKVVNLACPGETSGSLINTNAPSNGCENAPKGGPAYRKRFPLHVKYAGSQLSFAVSYVTSHPKVRLVSLMIGANDAFLCQETTADACKSELPTVLAKLKKNVATILSTIRRKAHYRGQILINNYYALSYGVPAIAAQSKLLNATVDSAAKPFGVRFGDGFGVLRVAAVHSGGDSCKAGLLTQIGPGTCGVHPSVAGQTLLAQAVENATVL